MYFTFLYNTFQNHDLMRAWKANRWPWDKAGTFVYTRFGLTFTSVSVPAPIFRKYPLSCWWICTVSDPSPKLWPGSCTAPPSPCLNGFVCARVCAQWQFQKSGSLWCAVRLGLLGYWVCFVGPDGWSKKEVFLYWITIQNLIRNPQRSAYISYICNWFIDPFSTHLLYIVLF